MNPLLMVAVPLVLVIVGMILNNVGLSFDQPESSQEQDPAKRLAAERQAYRTFFDQQRTRFLKRQKRVGLCNWLILATFVASFWWMYLDTVNKTTASNQIAAIQTVPAAERKSGDPITVSPAEGKEVILFLTRHDGTNVKYLIKSEKAGTSGVGVKDGLSKEPVPSWEVSRLGTALSIGDSALPLGIAVKISN
ncbi:MAG: hypothetical protein Q8S00_01300 [Deltaproteobacteria bacterium]|nr:hypothetical protein [Deltaproteobacteria bacterium]MDZ4347357.1 hypothetical protein [Candidatus Binatia bacterium]